MARVNPARRPGGLCTPALENELGTVEVVDTATVVLRNRTVANLRRGGVDTRFLAASTVWFGRSVRMPFEGTHLVPMSGCRSGVEQSFSTRPMAALGSTPRRADRPRSCGEAIRGAVNNTKPPAMKGLRRTFVRCPPSMQTSLGLDFLGCAPLTESVPVSVTPERRPSRRLLLSGDGGPPTPGGLVQPIADAGCCQTGRTPGLEKIV